MERIFILEAERNLRNAITILLEHAGYQIIVVSNGQNAQEQIQSFAPDIILCDSTLPYKSGLDILRSLRESTKTAEIPFILMSTHLSSDQLQLAKELGANGFLIKPFTEEELFQKLKSSQT